jgi:hypothetical protein
LNLKKVALCHGDGQSYGEAAPDGKAREVYQQAQPHRLPEIEPVGGNRPEQEALRCPDDDLRCEQGCQVVLEKEAQDRPQEGLGEQVGGDAGEQKGRPGAPAPTGISENDPAFNDNRQDKCDDQCPGDRCYSSSDFPTDLTSKSSSLTVTAYLEESPAVLKTLLRRVLPSENLISSLW